MEHLITGVEKSPMPVDETHVTLRQASACTADTSLLTYAWVAGRGIPHPDFNVQHVCRDWNRIRERTLEKGISGPGMQKPLDALEVRPP